MKKYEAIYKLYPQVVTIRDGEAFDAQENPVAYDEAAVQAEMDASAYKAQRAAAYPPIGEQLDALWKGGDAAADMLARVQAVKLEYPKP